MGVGLFFVPLAQFGRFRYIPLLAYIFCRLFFLAPPTDRDNSKRKEAPHDKGGQRYQEQTFDSFATRLIRNESIDARRELARRAEADPFGSAVGGAGGLQAVLVRRF